MEPPNFYVARHVSQRRDLELVTQATMDEAVKSNYDMITSFITNMAFRARVERILAEASAEDKSIVTIRSMDDDEVNIHPGEFMGNVVVFTSPWIDLDSDDPLVSYVSKQVLKHEVAYACFCGVNHIVIAGPKRRANIAQYAQAINSVVGTSLYMQLHIDLPLAEEEGVNTGNGNATQPYDAFSVWDTWNTIRTLLGIIDNVSVRTALRLPLKLPKMEVQTRWFAEPVRMLIIPASIFLPNAKGFPVLSKQHQALIGRYMRLRPTPFILLADTSVPNPVSQFDGSPSRRRIEPATYLAYIQHLQKTQKPLAPVERFGAGYQDFLQAPLQPLTDNLESQTYEVFERDPIKYEHYEKATILALEERDPDNKIVVAVVGAGRGPLVSRALRAAEATGRNIQLYAVEKNPNAYVTLLRHNKDTWRGRVKVIKSDMRSWNPDFKVDILISELLGSFGDNELSPECLDGVQRVLNPDGGVTIPTSYSAHFTPVMAPKIHADISHRLSADSNAAETPYVVYLHSVELLAENQYIHNAWEFSHPLPIETSGGISALLEEGITEGINEHNTRFSKATFKIPRRGIVHGLGGYFESVLYGDVQLSTRPDTMETKSKDMISWFPIFFPLKTPIYVPDLSELDVSMWRLTDDKKVWYEWVVEAYTLLDEGVRFRLGASDLHSSKKVACLM
ncbi:PRMT5 arginine-N-methyltransferase-domain-containing protein [Kalaharituber pfeilii]|nr:PRMT5 arginine-N-methyltransferase-domain-containing protein [Kalaharituber pfeilii]